jgi:hypothetical protein
MTTDREKAKIKAIGALFIPGAFPRQEQEGTERQLLQVYLMAVEDIPADFVAMACKRFIQGQVQRHNYTFRPMPPELAIEARRLRDKALDNNRLASLRLAKPEAHETPDPTPEERQRCAEMWAKAKAEIEAATISTRMPKKGKYGPAVPDYTPKFDVSDFPPSNASPQELRAWESRHKAGEAA